MSKIAYVLSGGGAKGSFQAGVIAQLDKKGIKPDLVIGTSVGASNGAGIAYLGAQALVDHWLSIKSRKEILSSSWWKILWMKGIFSLNPLKKWLQSIITQEQYKNPFCEVRTCSVSMIDGKVGYVSNLNNSRDNFITGILKSSAIPGVMEPIEDCVDGGVREHTPVTEALVSGADEIYVIICRPLNPVFTQWSMPKGIFKGCGKILSILTRALDDIMSDEVFINDLWLVVKASERVRMHVYAPDRWWLDTTEFDPIKIKSAIEAGMQAQELNIEDIRSILKISRGLE